MLEIAEKMTQYLKSSRKWKVGAIAESCGCWKRAVFGSGRNSSSGTRAEQTLLASRLNLAKLEVEELLFKMMQKEIAMKAMTKTNLELEKRVECIERETNDVAEE